MSHIVVHHSMLQPLVRFSVRHLCVHSTVWPWALGFEVYYNCVFIVLYGTYECIGVLCIACLIAV